MAEATTLTGAAVAVAKSRRRAPSRGVGLGVVLLLFALWWIGALFVAAHSDRAQVLLPSPIDVITAIPRLSVFVGPGTPLTYSNALQAIAINTLASGITLVGGIFVGASIGVGLGLALGWSAKLRMTFEAPLLLIRVIPVLALLPLFLSWFGGTQAGSVSFVAFAVFSMLFVNTLEAIRNVPPLVQLYARTLGASRLRVYCTVVAPAIVPELVGGFRVVLGLAWAILLAAEFLASQSGIGHILILAQQYLDTSRMVLIVILIMVYTYVLDRLLTSGTTRLTRWVPRKQL